MLVAIWKAMIYTPWWVYLIFGLLIRIGIQSLKPRRVAPWKVLLIPLIFLAMSFHHMLTHFHHSTLLYLMCLVGFGSGLLIGYFLTHKKEVSYDADGRKFYISGAPDTLCLLIVVFITKFYFGYNLAIDPEKMHNTAFEIAMLTSNLAISGIFSGRLLGVIKKSFWSKSPNQVSSI